MSTAGVALLISFVAAAGGLPGVWGIVTGIRKRRDDNAQFVVGSAVDLLKPVKEELAEARAELAEASAECKILRGQVNDLTAEVEHQRLIVNQTTSRLELANKRADYWESAFKARATE